MLRSILQRREEEKDKFAVLSNQELPPSTKQSQGASLKEDSNGFIDRLVSWMQTFYQVSWDLSVLFNTVHTPFAILAMSIC